MKPIILAALAVTVLSPLAHAVTLSVNFTDSTVTDDLAANEQAGLNYNFGSLTAAQTAVANWNNVAAAATGSAAAGTLNYDNGSVATGVSFTWSGALGQHRLPGTSPTVTPDDRMMKGNLDIGANSTAPAQLIVSGLDFVGTYSVVIYFDGDNGTAFRVASYRIGSTTVNGEDSENTNWGAPSPGQNPTGIYQDPLPGAGGNQPFDTNPATTNNDEGNFLVISGVSGSSFTLEAFGSAGTLLRAPINGFQVIGTPVPETSVALLGGLGLLGLLRRRRA